MIGEHERDSLADVSSTWMGEGGDLAARMAALADEVEAGGDASNFADAGLIRDVLSREYDPRKP